MDGSTANDTVLVVVVAPAMEADVVIIAAVQRDNSTVPKPGYSTLLRCPSSWNGPTFLCFLVVAWTAGVLLVVLLEQQLE